MPTDLVMPQMGESVAEGTVTKWYVQVGDSIEKDQTVLSISTDKVDAEIPAPAAGVISEILIPEGEKVSIGTVLAKIGGDGASADSPPAPAPDPEPAAAAPEPAQAAPAPAPEAPASPPAAPAAPPAATAPAAPAAPAQAAGSSSADRSGFYSPLVLNIARVEGVTPQELSSIDGSGSGGRVQKRDILAFVEARKSGVTTPAAPASSAAPAPAPPIPAGPDTEVVPMDSMRRAIADHMVRSVHTSPHVNSLHEVDMSRIVRARERIKNAFAAREGYKITYTTFFVAAAARALREFPRVNASVDGTNMILRKRINIGIAVALADGGLIVPVIKSADTMNLVGIARTVNDLVTRARTRKLAPDDVAGGTFTITNLGSAGSLTGTPIINQPQVAIIGVGVIKKRPVVIDDMIGIRDMMYLSMGYDHRLVDGMLAGQFLSAVTKHLETMDIGELE